MPGARRRLRQLESTWMLESTSSVSDPTSDAWITLLLRDRIPLALAVATGLAIARLGEARRIGQIKIFGHRSMLGYALAGVRQGCRT